MCVVSGVGNADEQLAIRIARTVMKTILDRSNMFSG
jgi:hypothetical protein